MKTQKRICSLFSAALLLAMAATTSHAQMTLKAVNQNPAYGDTNVFISFCGASTITGLVNGASIVMGSNYSIATINSGCFISNFTAGAKICVSLGAPLTSGSSGNLFNRNFNNPALPDYYTRWDKVELSYIIGNSHNVANLTADDFASVPLKIDNGSQALDWHFQGTMGALLGSLAALCNNNTNAVAINTTNGQIVRVISPHTAYSAPWPSLQPYADYVKNNSITVNVAGTYDGTGATNQEFQAQTYNFTALINSGGNLVLTGSVGVANGTNIQIAAADLTEGLYSAAPNYTVNGVATVNNNSVYDAVVRDILAAFNLGLPGTTRIDPRTSTNFTSESTQVWYNYPGNGVVTTSLDATNVFGALWNPGITFYNQFANILSTNTDAYGFPFTDTLFKPLLPIAGAPTLTITVMPDGSSTPPVSGEYFSGITVSGGIVTLTLTNLTLGSSNSIDRTSALQSPSNWQNVTNFIATTSSTNYSEAVRSTNTFYRARSSTP